MQISFNNKSIQLQRATTIQQLLDDQSFNQLCFAVMLNNTFVSKENYITTSLKDKDVVVTIQPMQGG